jgi:hypothetical protein
MAAISLSIVNYAVFACPAHGCRDFEHVFDTAFLPHHLFIAIAQFDTPREA